MTMAMETPQWLHEWLNIPFYEETPKCGKHKNKYLTVFCGAGSCSGNLFCEVCWKTEFVNHRGHPTLQVCIASHRAAVEKNAINSVVDTSDIQDYIINHKKVVYLRPNDKAPPLDHRRHYHTSDMCRACQRKIRDRCYSFCSISCKVGIHSAGQCCENDDAEEKSKIMRKKSSKGKQTPFASQLEENALVFEGSKIITKIKISSKRKRSAEESCPATIPTLLFLKTRRVHRRKGIPHRSPLF